MLKIFHRLTLLGTAALAYFLSYLVPKSQKIWVFGAWGGQRFSDNSKYLFLYTKKNHPEIRAIWLTNNRGVLNDLTQQGYEAYLALSPMGFLSVLRAGCAVVTLGLGDVNMIIKGKTKVIQLWHGMPLKKINYDVDLASSAVYQSAGPLGKLMIRGGRFDFSNVDVIYASSEECQQKFSSAFRIDESRIVITGFPRNDALFNVGWLSSDSSEYLAKIRNQVHYKYVVTYVPTYRDENRDLLGQYNFDADVARQTLNRLNAILIMKTHFYGQKLELQVENESYPRIYNPSDTELPDIYRILRETDILITDYSSVYFDFLLLNRPIIFTPFDLREYTEKERGFYYDYDEVTPGPKAKDWPEVFRLLEEVVQSDNWKEQRKAVCGRFNKYVDNKSSERVFNLIKATLG